MSESVDTPVGRWVGTVTHDGEVDDYTVTFAENGTLELATSKSVGSGRWEATGPGTFRLVAKEVFNTDVDQQSPNGHSAAYLRIEIDAISDGVSFAGKGQAVVHGPEGMVIYETGATTAARRVPADAEAAA